MGLQMDSISALNCNLKILSGLVLTYPDALISAGRQDDSLIVNTQDGLRGPERRLGCGPVRRWGRIRLWACEAVREARAGMQDLGL